MGHMMDPTTYRPPTLGPVAPALAPQQSPAPSTTPAATAAPAATPARRRGRLEAWAVPGNRDGAVKRKMQIIRDEVVKPATTGAGLITTRQILAEILQGKPANVNGHSRGTLGLVVSVFYWFRSRVRYVKDPDKRELFQTLGVTLREGLGDCDDMTSGLASLLKAAGVPVKARCITLRPNGPWAHIYLMAKVGNRWMALDATENFPPGWEARHAREMDLEL